MDIDLCMKESTRDHRFLVRLPIELRTREDNRQQLTESKCELLCERAVRNVDEYSLCVPDGTKREDRNGVIFDPPKMTDCLANRCALRQ